MLALHLRSTPFMKTSPLPVNESEAQCESKLHETAKFQCHGIYVIGFNLLLAAGIYGYLAFIK